MAEHGRLSETERVVDGFLQLMSAHRGEVEVIVTSATALDKSTQQRLESALKSSQYATKGKSVKFTHKVDPSIQGGLIVDLGDRSVDLSVSSRVNRLNTLLQQGI
jgi:F-type H+-transporting ATPase subunit O